jgi:hypothetical protein
METSASTLTERRRTGRRMSCLRCEVAWTGTDDSTCWVCERPGVAGPPPFVHSVDAR